MCENMNVHSLIFSLKH